MRRDGMGWGVGIRVECVSVLSLGSLEWSLSVCLSV